MGTIVQAQEIIKTSARSVSCTPVIPGFPWHQRRSDFHAICRSDWVNADAMRVLENVTNKLINKLRSKHDIPENHLPHKDDLWISEMRLDDFEYLSVKSTARSTYARCFHEVSAKKNKPSLVQLGFLSIRFVAWSGIAPELPDTTIYLGKRDKHEEAFILVDANGEYIDSNGAKRSAVEEGWTAIEKQYRFETDEVNKRLALLAGQSPPKPKPRWKPLQRTKKSAAQPRETTKSTPMAANALNSQAAQGVRDDEIQDILAESVLFANKNNTDIAMLSLKNTENSQEIVELHNNSTVLLSAPWTAETLIALASHFLAVPDPAQCDEEQWMRDWLEPALWLIEHTDDLDCARAWVVIELHIAAMIAGPTWHAKKANKPFVSYGTLRHVVGWNKETGELDGHNWISTAKALEKERWVDYAHIEYFGPPLFDEHSTQSSSAQSESSYAQGYGAQPTHVDEQSTQPLLSDDEHCVEVTAQAEVSTEQCTDDQVLNDVSTVSSEQPVSGEDGAQGEHCDQSMAVRDTEALEVIAQPEEPTQSEEPTQYYTGTELALQIIEGDEQGMTSLVAARLRTLIRKEYPDIVITTSKIDGYCLVAMQIALDTWYYFGSLADWNHQSPETQEAVEAAERSAQQRNAAQSNDGNVDSQGPPGDAWVSEEGGEL